MTLNLLLSLTDHILHLSLSSLMSNSKFSESQFIIPPLIKSVLNFSCQSLSCIFKLSSQVFNFMIMIGITIHQFSS